MKKLFAVLTLAALVLSGCSSNANAEVKDAYAQQNENTTDTQVAKDLKAASQEKPETLANKEIEVPKVNNDAEKPKRVVGYFTSWSAYARNVTVNDMDASLLTHINFAFANLNNEGKIVVGDSWVDLEKGFNGSQSGGHFEQLKLLKDKYPHIKTLISVGGYTWSGNFSDTAASPEKRKVFAQSAVEFVTEYGFDGVDIDWEFPVTGADGSKNIQADKQNYTLLLKETREALDTQGQKDGKHYILTIAAGPNPSFVQNTELLELSKYLDFINIMAYDYHGAWENTTGHNAPLYDNKGGLSVSNTVETILSSGVSPEKCNLGLAFYGRGWTGVSAGDSNGLNQSGTPPYGVGFGLGSWEGGVFDYWDLAQNYNGNESFKRYFDEISKTPYLYNGDVWISYDDAESISAKLSYANEKGLGGVMFWEFSGDKNKELQNVVAKGGFSGVSSAPVGESAPVSTPTTPPPNSTSSQNYPKWDANAIYTASDIVEYEGNLYIAKWWTQNEPPEPVTEWGVWEAYKGS